jgi:hypothetical protein
MSGTETPTRTRTEADPFGGISLRSNAELISWIAVSERLAAGPLAGDESLQAQVAFVRSEMSLRRMTAPKALTARERREMNEGRAE